MSPVFSNWFRGGSNQDLYKSPYGFKPGCLVHRAGILTCPFLCLPFLAEQRAPISGSVSQCWGLIHAEVIIPYTSMLSLLQGRIIPYKKKSNSTISIYSYLGDTGSVAGELGADFE